jgi:hypothetical protein
MHLPPRPPQPEPPQQPRPAPFPPKPPRPLGAGFRDRNVFLLPEDDEEDREGDGSASGT